MKSEIGFKDGVRPESLLAHARAVVMDLLAGSGNPSALVTCLGRSTIAQARAMYANLERTGPEYQRKLYGPVGDRIVDAYERLKAARRTPEAIVFNMAAAIIREGAERVSDHCADPAEKTVADISRAGLVNADAFIAAAKADRRVSKVLDEPANGCVHLVIPSPPPSPALR